MTYTFKNTPYNGIPFDQASEAEIIRFRLKKRNLECAWCNTEQKVTGLDVQSAYSLVPYDLSPDHPQNDAYVAEYNAVLFADNTGYLVVCPYCGMLNPTSAIEGEE